MPVDPGFADLYEVLTNEVNDAIYPSTKDHLREWYKALDEEPSVAAIVQMLQSRLDVDQWWLVNFEANHTRQDLIWPDDAEQALGMKFLVMRELGRGRVDIGLFGFHLFGTRGGGRPEDTAAEVIRQIFAPMASQLWRHLRRELNKAPAAGVEEPEKEPLPVPIINHNPDNPKTGRLFISYRREDSAPYAGRVGDRLKQKFGRDSVFMDVGAIPLGANFAQILREAVASCDVLLAIIGRNWLDITDSEGKRRLDIQDDFVRVEIGAALERNIPVIPILLDGTSVPKIDKLPPKLRELAHRNGIDVRHASFDRDMDELIDQLKKLMSA